MHLPNLGKTVSHSMTPSHARQQAFNDPEDPKLIEQLAKHSFMRVDDKSIQAFRTYGKTPMLKSGGPDLIRGELTADQVKPTAFSPRGQS